MGMELGSDAMRIRDHVARSSFLLLLEDDDGDALVLSMAVLSMLPPRSKDDDVKNVRTEMWRLADDVTARERSASINLGRGCIGIDG
jgi:hypothetical protein